MWRMLNHESPVDFVIATGVTQSLKQFVQAVFEEAGLDWREHVSINSEIRRQSDPMVICADNSKSIDLLGWQPSILGDNIPRKMYQAELENF